MTLNLGRPGGDARRGAGATDRPWRRPGALLYALRRIGKAVHPPITVVPMPSQVTKERDVEVVVRDGTVLRVNVYRPAGPGPFPVLLAAHPYRKDDVPSRGGGRPSLNFQYRILNQPEPIRISDETSWEAPDPAFWASHGYVVVNADLRGAGTSDGRGSLMSEQEAEDVFDLIEWAGTRPWSTGAVGMLGVSYLAISQYGAAALHPPHLRAICPWEGFTDPYRDFMAPGGVVEDGFSTVWQAAVRRTVRTVRDFGRERRRHPLRDDWWEAITPDISRIEVPVLVCASFSDSALHSQGSFRLLEHAGSRARFGYTHRGAKWAAFYSAEATAVQLRFFDRFLRGLDTPLPPPVRLEVRRTRTEIAEVRAEQEWPLARTRWTDLVLRGGGVLAPSSTATATPPSADGSAPAILASFRLRDGAAAFTLAIAEELELTGPMSLDLRVALQGASDANLFVGVEKWTGRRYTPFEGSFGYGRDRIAVGHQRLALRGLDPDASRIGEPVHRLDAIEPVPVGEPIRVTIALSASSTAFRAGDELRLVIAGRPLAPRNPLTGAFPSHHRPSRRGSLRVLGGPAHPSALRVPVVPARS